MTAALVQSYRYAEPSVVERAAGGARLVLATSSPGDAPNPFFFSGTLVEPRPIAEGMLLVARVARTRFYVPPAMLAKILAAADPVVTCTKESVRFESFSACAGVYARFDVGADAFEEIAHASPGTTNVDFNPSMRAVLARYTGKAKKIATELAALPGGTSVHAVEAHALALEARRARAARWTSWW